jgi:hypothetical protein
VLRDFPCIPYFRCRYKYHFLSITPYFLVLQCVCLLWVYILQQDLILLLSCCDVMLLGIIDYFLRLISPSLFIVIMHFISAGLDPNNDHLLMSYLFFFTLFIQTSTTQVLTLGGHCLLL